VQNFSKLSAAVHELSLTENKLSDDAENNIAVASAGIKYCYTVKAMA